VSALVCGSSIYRVTVSIGAVPQAQWRSICADCAGGIDSLLEILQGRLSKGVMERICRRDKGLFPKPSDIRFSCSCPDYATMCKHVAAALYGVGARLDERPELLFRLRAVDENELLASVESDLSLEKGAPSSDKVLEAADLSSIFDIELAGTEFGAGDAGDARQPREQSATSRASRDPSARESVRSRSKLGARNKASAKRPAKKKGARRKKAAGAASRRADDGGARNSKASANRLGRSRDSAR
jgi:uncharacterized Zn finger protein